MFIAQIADRILDYIKFKNIVQRFNIIWHHILI